MGQHQRLLGGLVLGGVLGALCAEFLGPSSPGLELFLRYGAEPVGKIFIRLLLMLVVPIVFSALVMGICELDLRHLGRLGVRTFSYTVVVSLIAVLLGVGLTHALQPGAGISAQLLEQARSSVKASPLPASTSAVDLLVAIVPSNPLAAAANNDMIGFVFFSVFFGAGLAMVKTPASAALKQAIAGLFDVCMRLIEVVLKLAPIGVFALLFSVTARVGAGIMGQLAAYIGVVLLGLSLQLFGVYSLSVKFLSRRSPLQFFRDIRLALLTAFSTASSNATLPTALRVADENLKLPRHVSRFVLTAGATMNQNGTALFEGVTVLFLAQAYGVSLSISQQVVVMIICVLAGIGTAGVPAGSLPVIAMIITMLGIPAEGIGLVLGVDRFLDMCRTVVNVAGDLAAAVFVARGEPDTEAEGAPELELAAS